LNLGPFWGSKRTLFERCHFESTDDALNGSAVYLNCTFDIYSSKPFGHTTGTGAIFINSDIQSFCRDNQYFVKGRGPVTAVDTRIIGGDLNYVGWRDIPDSEARYYQYNISLNNESILIGKKDSFATVDMTNKNLLNAYRFEYKNKVVYNTYNLLRGNDDWDPMGIKNIVLDAEKETGNNYINVPTLLTINSSQKTLETGKDSIVLAPTVYRFGNFQFNSEKVYWDTASEYKSFVELKLKEDGTCLVIPTNNGNETKKIIINASTSSGLQAASVLYIAPSFIKPPVFKKLPVINKNLNGTLALDYVLDMDFERS